MVDLKNPYKSTVVPKKFVLVRRARCRHVRRSINEINGKNCTRHEAYSNIETKERRYRSMSKCRPLYIVIIVLIIIVLVGVLLAYFLGAFTTQYQNVLNPPNPTAPLPPSRSTLHTFRKAAVCSDGPACAEIGRSILDRDGSAVDAAIATAICNGMLNMQSMGIGGGFLMTVYIRDTKTAHTLNAREVAPLGVTPRMYKNDASKAKLGPLAVGVPGELRGYWAAYKRFGKLPWKELIQPSINLCESGYIMSKAQFEGIANTKEDSLLRSWFLDENGKEKAMGSIIKPLKLCNTFRLIADNGGDDLYNGTLANMLIDDIKELGGIITHEDLINYRVQWLNPVMAKLSNGDTLYTMPPPGSGLILGFILNILNGYKFNSQSIVGNDNTVLTYHRIIEAFKYAYARRTELGDLNFNNITELIKNLTSTEYANSIREKINDDQTNLDPAHYGAVFYNKDDHGTSHISVLAGNGDAVSLTSTVNLIFGARITSKQTGIILNSGMDDFSSPDFINYFGLPGSPNNAIAPGKRALSSMTPSVIVDEHGDVRIVVGAAGGTKITTAVALVIMRYLYFGQNLKEAVDAPRFHHQLFPMEIAYEYGTLQQILTGLEAKGHKTARYNERGSVICAMLKQNDTIFANADYRKAGEVYGI